MTSMQAVLCPPLDADDDNAGHQEHPMMSAQLTQKFEVLKKRKRHEHSESPADEEKYRQVATEAAELAAQEISQMQRSIEELETWLTAREQDNEGPAPADDDVIPAEDAEAANADASIDGDGSDKEALIFPALPKVVLVMADETSETVSSSQDEKQPCLGKSDVQNAMKEG